MNGRRVQSSVVCVALAMAACGGDGDGGAAGDSSSGASESSESSESSADESSSGSTGDQPALPTGAVVWTQQIEGDGSHDVAIHDVTVGPEGQIYVTAVRSAFSEPAHALLFAYGADGLELWNDDVVLVGDEAQTSLAIDGDRVALAIAERDGIDGGYAVHTFTADGTERSAFASPQSFFGGEAVGVAYRDGYVVIATTAEVMVESDAGSSGFAVYAHREGDGEPVWSWLRADDFMGAGGHDVALADDGTIVAVGDVSGTAVVVGLDGNGATRWTRALGEAPWRERMSVVAGPEGTVDVVHEDVVTRVDASGDVVEGPSLDGIAVSSIAHAGGVTATSGTIDVRAGAGVVDGDGAPIWWLEGELDLRETVVAWHPDGDLLLVGTTYVDDEGVGAVLKIAAPSSTR